MPNNVAPAVSTLDSANWTSELNFSTFVLTFGEEVPQIHLVEVCIIIRTYERHRDRLERHRIGRDRRRKGPG